MNIETYLEKKGMGSESLSEPERKAISNFSLIWSLFEAQLLEENASARKIVAKCQVWGNNPGIDSEHVNTYLDYFKNRYVLNDETTYRYEHLHFRGNDQENIVKGVLLGEINDDVHKLACCLIIVLRFRNNYFHGIKWAYQFREQKENFETSCNLLADCLDRYSS